MKRINNGFTLIELVIVIIILGALGIATSSYISTGVTIYTDISERDKELNSARFVMERLRRDILNALPNSLVESTDKACLSFNPVIASSLYDQDFPIHPMSASSATIAPVVPFNNESIQTNDIAVVYLLNEGELSSNKTQSISSVNDDKITFNGSVSFPLGSPSKRFYIIRDKVEYCFSGSNLYRTKNTESPVLMADDIKGEFAVSQATLQRNGLAKVTYILNFDGQEVPVEQTLHVNNVP